ncbi:histidine phosphatase family protein [Alloscardovia macacae]|uniref:phosphoglycerate mutase (2,3-diphosphoglycerate-dependent) n=1 Tax=Alloscardovia macacae TaxID=1160091 RepID=A0A1Y2SYY1_9BIFI|nr:histidine phosphatase family protein [Alloscardovia macacae]OTA27459.1 histidine phosphatase family protein [Alloscardovia macacae]OTA28253.1 histidine phosphatase family protein [Alloscardovia macacae]
MNEHKTKDGRQRGRLLLLRHGQTAWSESGQYTGRTNIPLTAVGEEQARAAGERLRAFGVSLGEALSPERIFVSPLVRAQTTARLAGFTEFRTEPGLLEFDYGPAEGRTRFEVAEALGVDSWNVWDTGPLELPAALRGERVEEIAGYGPVDVVAGVGESAEQAAERVAGVIQAALPALEAGEDVLCVAHAHILRILTTVWLGLPVDRARNFKLDTAHFCVLGWHHADRVVMEWNV